MAGRRPRSGTGSARSGPASGTRWAWSSTTQPDPPGPSAPATRPGNLAGRHDGLAGPHDGLAGRYSDLGGGYSDLAGPDILGRSPGRYSGLAGPDIVGRSPGRWSPSRLPGPPHWLLAAIAVLVLAGAGFALASGASRPGRVSPDRPRAQPAVQQAGDPAAAARCSAMAGSFGRPGLANRFRERPQDAGCARPGTGQARAGGPRPGSSAICVALQGWATQFGLHHRCYPSLS